MSRHAAGGTAGGSADARVLLFVIVADCGAATSTFQFLVVVGVVDASDALVSGRSLSVVRDRAPQRFMEQNIRNFRVFCRTLTLQFQVVAFREVFKVFPMNGVQQCLVEQNIDFQQRLPSRTLTFQFPEGSLHGLSVSGSSSSSAVSRDVRGDGFFSYFSPGLKKCDNTSALWVGTAPALEPMDAGAL